MQKPFAIRSILEETLKRLDLEGPLRSHLVTYRWREIVGEPLASQTHPRLVRNRILFLDVSHPAWMQQLQFVKSQLVERINAYFKEPLIEEIRFRLGEIPPPPRPPERKSSWSEAPLDEETLQNIETYVRNIADEETRRIVREVLIKGAKLACHRSR